MTPATDVNGARVVEELLDSLNPMGMLQEASPLPISNDGLTNSSSGLATLWR
jgi:hypothetical protein